MGVESWYGEEEDKVQPIAKIQVLVAILSIVFVLIRSDAPFVHLPTPLQLIFEVSIHI